MTADPGPYAHVARDVPGLLRASDCAAPHASGVPATGVYAHPNKSNDSSTFGRCDYNDEVERDIRATEAAFLARARRTVPGSIAVANEASLTPAVKLDVAAGVQGRDSDARFIA